MKPLELKASLRAGQTAVGTLVFEFATPGIPRVLAATGVDFVFYDMEHSGVGIDTLRPVLAAARAVDQTALVRPAASQPHLIGALLDAGAHGIIAPMVESAEQAAQLVGACRYPPLGRRGAGFGLAHNDFILGDVPPLIEQANAAIVAIMMIETARGVENVNAIAAVQGVDMLWIGHYDLSMTLGIPGQFDHPTFIAAFDRILAAARERALPVGMMVGDVASARARLAQGIRCLAYGADVWLLQRVIGEGVAAIRQAAAER